MPLIMMVGIPCSGKTTRAVEIAKYIAENFKVDVQIINEEFLGLSKAEYLKDPQQEKILRASLKSNVEKYIDSQRVVILDWMNYIKGFRYELFCLARAAKTTNCLVYCDTDPDVAGKSAEQGGYENPFPSDFFTDYT